MKNSICGVEPRTFGAHSSSQLQASLQTSLPSLNLTVNCQQMRCFVVVVAIGGLNHEAKWNIPRKCSSDLASVNLNHARRSCDADDRVNSGLPCLDIHTGIIKGWCHLRSTDTSEKQHCCSFQIADCVNASHFNIAAHKFTAPSCRFMSDNSLMCLFL